MRRELQQYLAGRPDLRHFIRLNPKWYRILSRRPFDVKILEKEANLFYGRTFPQRIGRFNQQLRMVNFMLGMLQYYSTSDS